MGLQFLIYYKYASARAKTLANEVAHWLRRKGYETYVLESGSAREYTGCNFIIVAGGDGTVIGILRQYACTDIPVFGINLGRVGFLTSARANNWNKPLEDALEGKLPIQKSMALSWCISKNDIIKFKGLAVNEVVICRYYPARLMELEILICGSRLGTLRCDGLIISSSLGSTGYSVSAGGPILFPSINAICITPICAFTPGIKPMVFPGHFNIELNIIHSSAECYITIDGHDSQKLDPMDKIKICGKNDALTFFGDQDQFFGHLHDRGIEFEPAKY